MASCNAAVDSEERKEIFVSSLRLSKCGIQFVDLNCNEQDSLSSSPSLSLCLLHYYDGILGGAGRKCENVLHSDSILQNVARYSWYLIVRPETIFMEQRVSIG